VCDRAYSMGCEHQVPTHAVLSWPFLGHKFVFIWVLFRLIFCYYPPLSATISHYPLSLSVVRRQQRHRRWQRWPGRQSCRTSARASRGRVYLLPP
jgi:hypothetical protein